MITKKEDLIGTYIKNDNGELRELYVAICEKFLVDGTPKDLMMSNDKWLGPNIDCKVIGVYEGGMLISNNCSSDWKELTISDLKPIPAETPEEKEVLDDIEQLEWETFDSKDLTRTETSSIGFMSGSISNIKTGEDAEKALKDAVELKVGKGLDITTQGQPEFEQVEWKNGDELLWKNGNEEFLECNTGRYIGYDEIENKHIFIRTDVNSYRVAYSYQDGISKPESPEAKKEREELEAAYDLYCHAIDLDTPFDKFCDFIS